MSVDLTSSPRTVQEISELLLSMHGNHTNTDVTLYRDIRIRTIGPLTTNAAFDRHIRPAKAARGL